MRVRRQFQTESASWPGWCGRQTGGAGALEPPNAGNNPQATEKLSQEIFPKIGERVEQQAKRDDFESSDLCVFVPIHKGETFSHKIYLVHLGRLS